MLAEAAGRCDAIALQACPNLAQARHAYSEVMDGSTPSIFRGLIVDVQATGADADEDVAGASQHLVKEHFRAQMPAPPGQRRIDVRGEEMGVMKVDGQPIYEAKDLRVGLFVDGGNPAPA